MSQEIVDPEPHSRRKLGSGWEHIPRWVRLVLWAIATATVISVAYFTRLPWS
jgi:hypothetical protein